MSQNLLSNSHDFGADIESPAQDVVQLEHFLGVFLALRQLDESDQDQLTQRHPALQALFIQEHFDSPVYEELPLHWLVNLLLTQLSDHEQSGNQVLLLVDSEVESPALGEDGKAVVVELSYSFVSFNCSDESTGRDSIHHS